MPNKMSFLTPKKIEYLHKTRRNYAKRALIGLISEFQPTNAQKTDFSKNR